MQYNPYAYAGLPMQQPLYQQPYMSMGQMMQPQPQQQMQVPVQQPQQTQPQTQQPETLNNGGLIVVPTEDDVKKYPVAPGNLVTFRIENQPIIIEKSMGRSQFATPYYERYKLLKEDMDGETHETESVPTTDVFKEELDSIKKSIERIGEQMGELKNSCSDIAKTVRSNVPMKRNREEAEKK